MTFRVAMDGRAHHPDWLATAMMRWSLAVDASEEVSEHEGATMMQQESPAAGERGGVAL